MISLLGVLIKQNIIKTVDAFYFDTVIYLYKFFLPTRFYHEFCYDYIIITICQNSTENKTTFFTIAYTVLEVVIIFPILFTSFYFILNESNIFEG